MIRGTVITYGQTKERTNEFCNNFANKKVEKILDLKAWLWDTEVGIYKKKSKTFSWSRSWLLSFFLGQVIVFFLFFLVESMFSSFLFLTVFFLCCFLGRKRVFFFLLVFFYKFPPQGDKTSILLPEHMFHYDKFTCIEHRRTVGLRSVPRCAGGRRPWRESLCLSAYFPR